ncbi:MAG: DegV family protein [Erysipelotrichaceae bacterium]|nr:MAG: DegV family [Erysipelotrichaceae bacterium]TXT16215.1 MAG: DegV family protein [Erysipelotrichaceae bacterium]
MIQKIAILTDSGSDVPAEIVKEMGIFVLPLQVNYKDRSYSDGVDIDAQTVYENLTKEVPTTSLPTGQIVADTLQKIEQNGYTHILAVVLSSGLSGTHNMVQLMADHSKLPMKVIDTKNIGIGSGLSVIKAAQWAKEGFSFDDLIDKVKDVILQTKVYFVLNTLEYLQKGGRIGKVSAFVGQTLDLKPVITCNDEGIYTTLVKVRGRKGSLTRIKEIACAYAQDGKSINIAFAHGNAMEEITRIKEDVLSRVQNVKNIYLGPVSPALGVHTGPGLIGIAVQIEK